MVLYKVIKVSVSILLRVIVNSNCDSEAEVLSNLLDRGARVQRLVVRGVGVIILVRPGVLPWVLHWKVGA